MSFDSPIARVVRRVYHLFRIDKLFALKSYCQTGRLVPDVRVRYEVVLSRVRATFSQRRRIKVLFLISDESKWKMQSLFDAMRQSSRYDPVVAVNLWGWHESVVNAEMRARKAYAFFAARKMTVVYAWDFESHKPLPLDGMDVDVVFYGQPWDVHPAHMPDEVSKFALTCYIPYAVQHYEVQNADCALSFHRLLWRHFVTNETLAEECRRVRGTMSFAGKVEGIGHTMFDDLNNQLKRHEGEDKQLVVYAPHWSFTHPNNPNGLNISTFLQTGLLMLEYAKKHRELKWAYKPHPVLIQALAKSGVMSQDRIKSYYHDWEQIAECCYDGSYSDLFARSRTLITDCGSFMTEYAVTGEPVVWLISPTATTRPNKASEKLAASYYRVVRSEDLEPVLDDLLVKGNDPKREARLSAAKAMNLTGTDAAGNIIRHLEELILGEDAGEKEA